jgi:alkylation response protein AidB-like acyl-CoA dehydrogenase
VDLLPSDEQNEIVATVRSQLRRDFDLFALADRDGQPSVVDHDLWSRCADLGWFGLGLDEKLGGVGYSLVEEALLFGELGRHATPGPFLPTVLGARLAAEQGDADLASSILAGERIVVLAEPHDDADATVGAQVVGRFRVTDHGSADLVLAVAGGAMALVEIDVSALEALSSFDPLVPTAIGSIDANSVVFDSDAAALLRRADVLIAAELAGMARATCEQSTEYAKDREQFGTPIGAFQAVKHRCADMAVKAEAAECSVRYAALALVGGDDASGFFIHAARIVAANAAIENAQANVQNHGGIGFTWEHTAHRYVTRSQVRTRTLGGHRQQLHELLAESAPA